MLQQALRNGTVDRMGMTLSGLCAVHCVASAVLVTVLGVAGSVLLNPLFHEVGLGIAIVIGAVALGRGALEHGYMMPVSIGSLGLGIMAGALTLPHGGTGSEYAILGVALLALGHDLNRRAVI